MQWPQFKRGVFSGRFCKKSSGPFWPAALLSAQVKAKQFCRPFAGINGKFFAFGAPAAGKQVTKICLCKWFCFLSGLQQRKKRPKAVRSENVSYIFTLERAYCKIFMIKSVGYSAFGRDHKSRFARLAC